MRFDVPTIGPQTIEGLKAGGGIAVAIEANKTIIVQREETLRMANQSGIAIVSLSQSDIEAVGNDTVRKAA